MSEKERLEKIRQRQIAARDPGVSKIRGYDWSKHASKKLPKQRNLYVQAIIDMPARFKGAIAGILFGCVLAIILYFAVLTPETELLAVVPVLICGIVGFVIGSVMQEKIPQ